MAKNKDNPIKEEKADLLTEKTYTTKELETSVVLLECFEDEILVQALLFLSNYADMHENNPSILQFLGILPKLLKLLQKKSIVINRLALRLLNELMTKEEAISEIDQEQFETDLLRIGELFITNDDEYIKDFSLQILEKISNTNRARVLLYTIDLLNPIFGIINNSENTVFLEHALKLFYKLIDIPEIICLLPDLPHYQPSTFVTQLQTFDENISPLLLEIFQKLTHFCVETLQKQFKTIMLVEIMFDIILDRNKKEHHEKAFTIIENCLNSDITESYYVRSRQFLEFTRWAKTCSDEYFLQSLKILEKLSSLPNIKQLLFDLSVEDCIIHFLRSFDKAILNKTCNAISNMSTHEYCCDQMLTPVVLKTIFNIMKRNDPDIDQENTVALNTLHNFVMRNYKTIEMLIQQNELDLIFTYLKKGLELLPENSFLQLLEIIIRCLQHSQNYKMKNMDFYNIILKYFDKYDTYCVLMRLIEIMSMCIDKKEFRNILLSAGMLNIIIKKMTLVTNESLLKFILTFIYNILVYKKVAIAFLESNLIKYLKEQIELYGDKIILYEKLLHLIFNLFLPIKLFETNKIDVTDKLPDKFYIIDSPCIKFFPFLEVLKLKKVSSRYTIYVVNYRSRSKGKKDNISETDSQLSVSSKLFTDNTERFENKAKTDVNMSIKYEELYVDPYLALYILHVDKEIRNLERIEDKIKYLAEFIDKQLCGYDSTNDINLKMHSFKMHIESLKNKFFTNIIPIGYVRMGFHLEKALLFKAIADKLCIPSNLNKRNRIYWNEVALFKESHGIGFLRYFVVDLMRNIGELLPVGSREANFYCHIK